MDFSTIILIALGLSLDAFAVSIASGVTIKRLRFKHALIIAAFFGGFQAAMPIAGWQAGVSLRSLIQEVDHWLAFSFLTVIGCKMIYESSRCRLGGERFDPLTISALFLLSLATSIDALVVGLSLSFLKVTIWIPALIIGAITFFLSLFGVFIGDRCGHFFENKIQATGGLILIAIGLKILLEHLLKTSTMT